MPISAILFDLDNTLYPASSGLMQLVDTRIIEYVQNTTGISLDEAQALRGQYLSEFGTTLRGLQQQYDVDNENYLSYIHGIALESFLASDAELDQLLGQVKAIKAVFTNSPLEYARRVLKALGIEQHFDYVFDLRFFEFVPKPHPSTYQHALEVLGVSGSETVIIEDTLQNLPPAKALGLTTILVDEQGRYPGAQADYLVPDVLSALRIILENEREQVTGERL